MLLLLLLLFIFGADGGRRCHDELLSTTSRSSNNNISVITKLISNTPINYYFNFRRRNAASNNIDNSLSLFYTAAIVSTAIMTPSILHCSRLVPRASGRHRMEYVKIATGRRRWWWRCVRFLREFVKDLLGKCEQAWSKSVA